MAMAGSNEINGTECRSVVPLNTWVLISNFKLAYNLLRRPDGTFNRHLAEFLDRKVPANATPVDGVFSFDVVVHRLTNLLCRVYQPASASTPPPVPSPTAPLPVILFFHGGSFAHSSSNSAIYDALCRRLVSMCHAVVVSVNYRRAPEFRYPCAYEDGWAALNWVATRPWLHGDDGNEEEDDDDGNSNGGDGDGDVVGSSSFSGKKKARIFLAGDSSGGNIAHHVAVRSIGSGTKLSGVILLNPMFGGQERKDSELKLDGKYFVTLQDRDWYWKAFLPEGADRDHPACNPFGPNGIPIDGLSFPKSLVAVSGFDLLRDWQLDYADGLKRARQDVQLLYLEQATIGFYLLPNNDHFFLLMDEIKQFVNSSS